MALPVNRNITIYKGDTFTLDFRLRARTSQGDPGVYIDLTGATARAQIRPAEDGSLSTEFTCATADQTTTDGKGRVQISLTPAQTSALPDSGGVWDVQVEFPDGTVRTYLKGTVSITKEVTRVAP